MADSYVNNATSITYEWERPVQTAKADTGLALRLELTIWSAVSTLSAKEGIDAVIMKRSGISLRQFG